MKNCIYLIIGCIFCAWVGGCSKYNSQTDFKKFLGNHEIVYTGAVGTAISQPGNLEIGLKWKASSDPSITKYVIYYNNNADSLVVNVTAKTDTIRAIIKGLSEYTYSFTIYSFDANGNKSIPTDINNVKAYGPIYISTLLNRGYDAVNPYSVDRNGYVTLNFIAPDTINTINVGTTINYTNRSGVSKTIVIGANSSTITIPDYKSGTPVTYQSSYIPVRTAMDVFTVPKVDTFPTIIGNAPCDKSLFSKLKLPYDFNPLQSNTDIDVLWDGATTPQGYPSIFHSDGSTNLPGTLTFDMGKVYNKLTQIEEIGRNCCHNPDDFEVWGIADITNAATTVPPNDPTWKANSIAKGWTLLKEVFRTDDGVAPLKTNLDPNLPPIRYIRIRVIHDANGNTTATNMSQITLYYDVLN